MMRIKFLMLTVIAMLMTVFLVGCGGTNAAEGKLSDLDFSVIGQDEQPDTLRDIIAEKADKPFQLSYTVGEDLYIAVGYGTQQSTGYSITVNEFYETKDSLVIYTSLIGPGSVENVTSTPSTPYIVIKTHNIEDKTIEFK
jgi:hypothetical protein